MMDLIELVIDELSGEAIEAISIVDEPAIEADFVALKKEKVELKVLDEEKRILLGPLLIPNKKILRYNEEEDKYYEIFFSESTVRRAMELYLKQKKHDKTTVHHKLPLEGLYLSESWIVEDSKIDKSALYDMEMPVGTWMGAVKVENDKVWNEYVKTGNVKGFSIEGYFKNKEELSKQKDIISELKNLLKPYIDANKE